MLTAFLSSPYAKQRPALGPDQTHSPDCEPLLVHIPDVERFARKINAAEISMSEAFEMATVMFQSAQSAVGRSGDMLVVTTVRADSSIEDEDENSTQDQEWISKLGSRRLQEPIYIVPTNSAAQQVLLEEDGRKWLMAKNLHGLRTTIRASCPEEDLKKPLLCPGADWTFLDGTPAAEVLQKSQISQADMKRWIQEMKGQFDAATLQHTIAGVGKRQALLEAWGSVPESLGAPKSSRWSVFPAHVQKAIALVEEKSGEKELYEHEARLLERILHPDDVTATWDDIVVDDDVKEDFNRLIKANSAPQPEGTAAAGPRSSKRRKVGGALVYGPPGTGKTYLAGVLARESGLVTISVSAAELESKWIGDTEKAIAALFNLGRMLGPSIIFMDEADGLFRARTMSSHSWERTQVNQFLLEMGGVGKHKNSPFVLLCTNLPHELDHAVLRRVPAFFYIGLPSLTQRERILKVQLRDWVLGADVNLGCVASSTTRFSGSDLQHLCDKATFICEASAEVAGDGNTNRDTEPVIRQTHFDEALMKTSPKWSRELHIFIKHWAEEFDQVGYKKIVRSQTAEEQRLLAEARPPTITMLAAGEKQQRSGECKGQADETLI